MIYELENFLDANECIKFINLIENNNIIVPFTNAGNFTNNKWTDIDLATNFFNKLNKYNINDNIIRPNNIITSGKYIKGDQFSLHTDTGLFYDIKNKEETRWTLLIYLNDNYEGGNTDFYLDNFSTIKTIKPKSGKAILFDIDLWHKGNEVLNGTKYWIGCEIIGKMIR